MTKFLILALLVSSQVFAQTPVETTTEVKPDPGPTFPLVKEIQNREEARMHMGLNLGINNPEGSRGSTPELGVDVGFQPVIPFGVGLELSTSRFDGADTEYYKRTTFLVRGTYNFGGEIPVIKYSYVGLATGAVWLNDGTELGIAPVTGFDIPLEEGSRYSLGFTAKYLFVTSKDPDSLITSGSLKYWF